MRRLPPRPGCGGASGSPELSSPGLASLCGPLRLLSTLPPPLVVTVHRNQLLPLRGSPGIKSLLPFVRSRGGTGGKEGTSLDSIMWKLARSRGCSLGRAISLHLFREKIACASSSGRGRGPTRLRGAGAGGWGWTRLDTPRMQRDSGKPRRQDPPPKPQRQGGPRGRRADSTQAGPGSGVGERWRWQGTLARGWQRLCVCKRSEVVARPSRAGPSRGAAVDSGAQRAGQGCRERRHGASWRRGDGVVCCRPPPFSKSSRGQTQG